MADKRIALPGARPANLLEHARNRIDDAFLGKLEKRLRLTSPDHLFRRNVLMASEDYLLVPPGGLAALSRKCLREDKTYLNELQTLLSRLLELLPHETFNEHAQASLIRVAVIGKAPQAEQPRRARQLFKLRAGLEDLLGKVAVQATEFENVRISPNDKLAAERMLVGQLAGIFLEGTGHDPRKHTRGNTDKDNYSGEFFDFVDDILRRLGSTQSAGARGKMIIRQLRTFSTAKK